MGFLTHATLAHSLTLSLSRSYSPLPKLCKQTKTMQQKVVIKVPLNGQKSRCKALQIAVGVPGVTSAALTGQEMNQIEVTGDGIDAVALTTLLRKKVGYSELLSVGPVPEDNDDGSSDSGGDQAAVQIPVGGYYHYPYPYAYEPGHMYGFRDQNPDSCCMM